METAPITQFFAANLLFNRVFKFYRIDDANVTSCNLSRWALAIKLLPICYTAMRCVRHILDDVYVV